MQWIRPWQRYGDAMPDALQISQATARRFLQRATGLDAAFPDTGTALRYLGYVQIDPINVCGRMHDLILRNRVAGYEEGGLMRHLHEPPGAGRTAFEHHLPGANILVALPADTWPHLRATMQAHQKSESSWSGQLEPDEKMLARRILAQLSEHGPLCSGDIAGGKSRAAQVWGSATLAKNTLQKLFFHGRVLIARREGTRRYYDLPERVLPAEILGAKAATVTQTARWRTLAKLQQHRLTPLKRAEFPAVADVVQRVTLSDVDAPPLYCFRADLPLFAAPAPESSPARLLAPLDPIIYERRVTAAVWDSDYSWEVYTPPQKRVRGYYALPVLSRDALVGHVDPKADRKSGRLKVVSRKSRRGHPTAGAVRELACFLGLR